MSVQNDVDEICEVLRRQLAKKWDGKECILELKKANYQWRQMEWIGWFFEYKAFKILQEELGGKIGPKYGNTQFDYLRNNHVWDFKSHIDNASSHPWAILNDCEAVDHCLDEYNGLGFIIARGTAEYDEDGSFKAWHDSLKGKRSDYEKERIRRGARSRRRKISLSVTTFQIFRINNEVLQKGIGLGWVKEFQKGMRNADGSPRRSKYMINVERIPSSSVLGCGVKDIQTTLGD